MKSESRDHICPRCGSYLPTITVQVPVYLDHQMIDGGRIVETTVLGHYEEREELAECVRCTGSY